MWDVYESLFSLLSIILFLGGCGRDYFGSRENRICPVSVQTLCLTHFYGFGCRIDCLILWSSIFVIPKVFGQRIMRGFSKIVHEPSSPLDCIVFLASLVVISIGAFGSVSLSCVCSDHPLVEVFRGRGIFVASQFD